MTFCRRLLINTILHEFNDSIYSGNLSEDRKLEKGNNCAWWSTWRKERIESCHTCNRIQRANGSTGKKFGLIIYIQEPNSTWEAVYMDLVTALPPSGDKSYYFFLVILDGYRETLILLPCHKDDNVMDTTLILWNRVIFHTGLFGTRLSVSTTYHPQTDDLEDRMIQTLEDMIRRFCAYLLEFKDSDGFTHYWCTVFPELELEYNTSVHSSTGHTPAMLEKGWNTRLPEDKLRKDLI
ncbi:hypothetical protein O181_003431 [Austropuccinia psidii MF-1]|uniref:Integrase catalytic domain-containing protein n=1 Tax=Austropuccinia psidii MF-1 TaxID=1389203 RepID=A0A9Q3BEY6_9BASI|nr:hypothetical protein [Austropuccinia psidii MF-1]